MMEQLLIPVGSVVELNEEKKIKYLIIKNFLFENMKKYVCIEIGVEKIKNIEIEEEEIQKVLFLGMQSN